MTTLGFDPKGEYVVDTSVIYSSIEGYPEEMSGRSKMTHDQLVEARDRCFDVISAIEHCLIAIDNEGIIEGEYGEEVFRKYCGEYPTQWYNRMVACDKVRTIDVGSVDKSTLLKARRRFGRSGLSLPDCQFVFTASRTNRRTLLHRDSGYSDASGFINKHYHVKQIHVLEPA